ncbi:MAG: S8 family serine peptidase [Acidobacteriota bacterium]
MAWLPRPRFVSLISAIALATGLWVPGALAQPPRQPADQTSSSIRRVVSGPDRPLVSQSIDVPRGSINVSSIGPDGHQFDVSGPSVDAQRVIIEMRERPTAAVAGGGRPSEMSSERERLMQTLQGRGGTRIHHDFRRVFNGVVATVNGETRAALTRLAYVKRVRDDVRVYASLTDSVPLIRAPDVWTTYGSTGAGVKVAVIDTGVDYTHPDLGGAFGPGHKVVGGYDFVNLDADPMDDFGHGTHVAGIIAANGVMKGVAPDAQILAYKVLNGEGWGYTSDIIAGIERAVADGAKVANLSLGGSGAPDDPGSQAIDNATAAGMLCVVAAANSGPGYQTIGSPGVARTALTIGASTKTDGIASFSSRGYVEFGGHYLMKPDMVAPGQGIVSTVPLAGRLSSATRYMALSGTSMATPHVAGAAALLVQLFPTRTPAQLRSMLTGSAHDIGFNALTQGSGRLDVFDAVGTQATLEPTNLSFDLFANGSGTVTRSATVRVSNPTGSAQTYQLGTAGTLPAGSRLDLDRSALTLQSGAFADIVVSLTVDTTVTPDAPDDSASYSAAVTITGSASTARLPVVFLKSATIAFTFSSTPLLVQLYDRQSRRSLAFTPPTNHTVRPTPTGTYDIVTVFGDGGLQLVTREQVAVSGAVALTILGSEATHAVTVTPRDEHGAVIVSPFVRTMAVFGRMSAVADPPAIFMYTSGPTVYRFSALANGWDAAIIAGAGCDPAVNAAACDAKYYNYTWTSAAGRTGDEVVPAVGASYRRLVQTHRPPTSTGTAMWRKWMTLAFRGTNWFSWWMWDLWAGNHPGGSDAVTTAFIEAGVSDLGAVRFAVQDDLLWFGAGEALTPTAQTPGITSSFARLQADGSFGLQVDPLYDLADSSRTPSYTIPATTVNFRLGSAPLSGPLEFRNSTWGLSAFADPVWWPGLMTIRAPILTDASYAIDRRGRATSTPWTFDLYRQGSLVSSPLASSFLTGVLASSDAYQLVGRSSAFTTGGASAQLTSTIDLDTRLSDPNPPYLGPLQVWDGTGLVEQLTGAGSLRFEARDDVGLASVTAEYKVGSDWLPLAATASGTWYQAVMPPLGPSLPVSVRVVATDLVGNRFSQVWAPAYVASAPQTMLTVAVSGSGAGRIVSQPAGIDCGATCAAVYASATTVTLVATPSGDAIFGGWLGACTGSSPTCVTTVTGAQSAVAVFLSSTLRLAITLDGTGSGVVTSSPTGITCGTTCSATFARGTIVALQPAPSPGSAFLGWGGDCSGTASCSVTIDQDRRVTAAFEAVPTPLVTGFSPGSASAGWAAFRLTISGQNFRTGAVVMWNGVPKATTFVNATTLTVDVAASEVASPGSVKIGVVLPGNGVVSADRYYLVDNLAPATRSVDPACTDANLDGRCDDGSGFKTLKAAIAAANVGDYIILAAGQHTVIPPLLIDKSVVIYGAGPSATVIVPGGNTTSCSGDGQAWLMVPEGVSASLSNLGFDGLGFDIAQALRVKGAYSAFRWSYYNLAIKNIRSACASGGTGVFASGVLGLEIGRAEVSQIGGTGFDFNDGSRTRIWYSNISGTTLGVHSDTTTQTFVSLSRLAGNLTAARTDGTSAGLGWNWWGCNAGPGQTGCDAIVGAAPTDWIQLGVSAVPHGASATVTASLVFASTGLDTTPWGQLPDGIPVRFTASQGVISSPVATINGRSVTTFNAARAGTATVSATVDNETVSTGFSASTPSLSVTGVTPAVGLSAGGTAVVIGGTGFATGASVTIGGVAATNVVVNNAVSISARTPAHAAGIVDVVVTNPGSAAATAAAAYTYVVTLPVLTWPTPSAMIYGTPLSSTQLNATASVAGTLAYTPSLGTVLGAGAGQTLSVAFTPTDLAHQLPATKTVTIDVSKATPLVTWTSPAAITYGTALSSTQLNATANVPGTLTYTPSLGTLVDAGNSRPLSVTFTPTDAANYASVTKTVTIDVAKANPVVTWIAPAGIDYGTVLGPTQLNATATVAGTMVYTPPAGTVLTVGTQTLSVTFTPSDSANYAAITKTVTIEVAKATPVITWASPAGIEFGTAVGPTQLNATADTQGVFVYAPPAGTLLNAGAAQTLSVNFTPTDSANYAPATRRVTIDVAKRVPTLTWSSPAGIVYGTALSAAQLNATADVAGTTVYSPASGAMLNAGSGQTLSATFTPSDLFNYAQATKTTTIDVAKAIPVVRWANPAPIVYGTALSATQLNASASIPGVLVYAPAAGAIPGAGAQPLSVTLTPTDRTNYEIVIASATIVVSFSGPAHGGPSTGTVNASQTQLTYSGVAYALVNGRVTFPDCSVYIALGNGMLISAGPAPGCTPPSSSPAGSSSGSGSSSGGSSSSSSGASSGGGSSSSGRSSGGGAPFAGPGSGGPSTGSVSGNTLTYLGATYAIVNGKVTFPDCTWYIALGNGMLIAAGPAPGCTVSGSSSGGGTGGSGSSSGGSSGGSSTGSSSGSSGGSSSGSSTGGGGSSFAGPGSGGPSTGSVSGNTLNYNGTAYAIVDGKVTFPDCSWYIALGNGMLIAAGPAPGCTTSGSSSGGASSSGGSGSSSGGSSSGSSTGSSSSSSGGSSSGSSTGGGGSTFAGPGNGGPSTGSVSGNTLNYNGTAYAIVDGKVTFPDCSWYIALNNGMLIAAGPAPGCTTSGSSSGGGTGGSGSSSGGNLGGGSSSGSSGSGSSSSGSGGGSSFAGPGTGGPAVGSVNGTTLTYNGATYPIVNGKVTFPDCTVFIALDSGTLIRAGLAASCVPADVYRPPPGDPATVLLNLGNSQASRSALESGKLDLAVVRSIRWVGLAPRRDMA